MSLEPVVQLLSDAYFVYDAVCREVWDVAGGITTTTAEAPSSGLQHQLSQSTVAITSMSHHLCHSFQSQQTGALLKPASVQQSFSTSASFLPSGLPLSVNRQADQSAILLEQVQQLIESHRLPNHMSSINSFSQELLSSLPAQQIWRHADGVRVSSSVDDTTGGTSEAHTSETYSTQNISCVTPAVSAVESQVPSTVFSQETVYPSAAAASTQLPPGHQYAAGEMRSPFVTDSVNQLSLFAHLQQLQQMYMESAANALHSLYVLQQQVIPASSTIANSTSTISANSTADGSFEDAVHSQASN